jgi:enoyl-CoA hydratase/carnithine racemase
VSFVAVERDGAVALVRLERDEKLNAISTAV